MIYECYEPLSLISVIVKMTEKLDGKCESLKKDDIGVHLVKDFLFKPDLTACKVYLKIIIETIIHVPHLGYEQTYVKHNNTMKSIGLMYVL